MYCELVIIVKQLLQDDSRLRAGILHHPVRVYFTIVTSSLYMIPHLSNRSYFLSILSYV